MVWFLLNLRLTVDVSAELKIICEKEKAQPTDFKFFWVQHLQLVLNENKLIKKKMYNLTFGSYKNKNLKILTWPHPCYCGALKIRRNFSIYKSSTIYYQNDEMIEIQPVNLIENQGRNYVEFVLNKLFN